MDHAKHVRKVIQGRALPLRGNEIDTDRIVPARFLKEITFEKMGDYFFYDARYDEKRQEKDHPINDLRYMGASIMVVEKNFGCGSSREHAAQAVQRYGINALIGESFAEIFAGNCKALGVPVVTMSKANIDALLAYVELHPQHELILNIENNTVSFGLTDYPIYVPSEKRQAFLEGTWDELELLKGNLDKVYQRATGLPYFNNFNVKGD